MQHKQIRKLNFSGHSIATGLSLLALLLFGVTAPVGGADDADLVLLGGAIYTGDPDRPRVGAVALRDGRVAYLGDSSGVAPLIGRRTRVVTLGAHAAYPGFVDAGARGYRRALLGEAVDLTGTRDFDEAVRRVARAVRDTPPNRWVIGWGWDQNDWVDRRFPRALPLEAVSASRPVVLFNRELSAGVVNLSAMGQAGIDQSIPDPPGGRFLRLKGNPTGCLADRALDEVWRVLPRPTQGEALSALRAIAANAAAQGWTARHEIGLEGEGIRALAVLGQATGRDRLPIRLHGVIDAATLFDSSEVRRGPPRCRPGSRVEMGGLRWVLDGGLSTRGAALGEPYADESWNSGTLAYDDIALRSSLRAALDGGWQPVIEASGDAAVRQALSALDTVLAGLPAEHRGEVRPRLLRGAILPDAGGEGLARLGVPVTVYPGRLPDEQRWVEDRLGLARMERVLAWRTLAEASVPLSFGSDTPAGPEEPARLFHAAITRQDGHDRPRGGWYPVERLTRAQALAGLTGGAAATGRRDDAAGTLATGGPADITVLSADLMTLPEPAILQVRAVMTIVDGEVTWERR